MRSKHIKGVRARLYQEAQHHLAYYIWPHGAQERTAAFIYEIDDLVMALGFEEKKQAQYFQNWLDDANHGTAKWFLHGKATDITVENVTTAKTHSRILISDYDASTFESPAQTFEDVARDDVSSASSAQELILQSDLCTFQSIEKYVLLKRGTVQRAHIIDRNESKRRKLESENNLLALTPSMHLAYDGPNCGVPTIAIRPCNQDELQGISAGASVGGRTRVCIAIEFQSPDLADATMADLKECARRTTDSNSAPVLITWVDVTDAVKFSSALTEKYLKTKRMWDPESSES